MKLFYRVLNSAVLIASLISTTALGATYYTAISNGNDAHPGTSSQPFKTIKKGVSVLRAGDTLFIRAGIYPESVCSNVMSVPAGKSWSSPVTIAGYPGETVIMKPTTASSVLLFYGSGNQYLIIQDLIIDSEYADGHAVRLAGGAHHIRLLRLEIRNARSQGIMITWGNTGASADYNEVINCDVHHNGKVAGQDHGMYIATSYNLIEGNTLHDNAGYGVQVYNGYAGQFATGNTVRNNKFYGNATLGGSGGGIVLAGGGGNIAYNNFVWSDKWGINTYGNQKVYHNTVYRCVYGIWVKSGSADVRNNIVWGNTVNLAGAGTFSGNLTVDPSFVDPIKYDLRLKSGSPAIDAVSSLAEVSHDHFATARPQGQRHDAGAHEYRSSTTISAPSNLRVVSVSD